MNYFFETTITNSDFESAIEKVTEELRNEGFGIVTQIDVRNTFREKLGVEFRQYRILGACNPQFAFNALNMEEELGVFLPCNVVVTETTQGKIRVMAVDPVASMAAVTNKNLAGLAESIREKVKQVVSRLH